MATSSAVDTPTNLLDSAKSIPTIFRVQNASNHPQARHIAVDGIRGWMSFIVLLHHCYLFVVLPTLHYDAPWLRFATAGHFAVLVFFVLSGFVLSIGFIENGNAAVLRHLALRRYPRLAIPILASCFFAYLLMKAGFMASPSVAAITNDASWLGSFYTFDPSFVGMLRFAGFDAFFRYPMATYNPNLWTMSFELIGSYVVFSALLLVPRRLAVATQMLLAGIFYCLDSYYFCFACGVLLALFSASSARDRSGWRQVLEAPRRVIVSLAAIGATLVYITFPPAIPAWLSAVFDYERAMMLAAFAFVFGCLNANLARRAFESAISQFMGKISFPLYLVQIPVICSFSSLVFLKLTDRQWLPDHKAIATIAFTVACSLLFAIVMLPIERASIRFARAFSRWLLPGANPVPSDIESELPPSQHEVASIVESL